MQVGRNLGVPREDDVASCRVIFRVVDLEIMGRSRLIRDLKKVVAMLPRVERQPQLGLQ